QREGNCARAPGWAGDCSPETDVCVSLEPVSLCRGWRRRNTGRVHHARLDRQGRGPGRITRRPRGSADRKASGAGTSRSLRRIIRASCSTSKRRTGAGGTGLNLQYWQLESQQALVQGAPVDPKFVMQKARECVSKVRQMPMFVECFEDAHAAYDVDALVSREPSSSSLVDKCQLGA